MADGGLYGHSGGGAGGLYGSSGTTYGPSVSTGGKPRGNPKPKKKKGGLLSGALGLGQHALGDIKDITIGTGPGLVAAGSAVIHDVAALPNSLSTGGTGRPHGSPQPFKNTVALGKGVAKSYQDYYGPLAHGDVDTFLNNVYKHPVNLVLDAATIASLGLGGAAKVGIITRQGGKVLELTNAEGKVIATKPLARGELRARLQKGVTNLGNKEIPVLKRPAGMAAAKAERTRLSRQDANLRAKNIAFEKALRKNSKQPAKVAAALRARFDRTALDQYTSQLKAAAAKNPKGTEATALKIITDPKVQHLFDNPTAKIGAVLGEAEKLGKVQQQILNVPEDIAKARKNLAARIAGGAKWDPETKQWVGGPSIEELQGRGHQPVYLPDTSSVPRKGYAPGRGGGVGIPNVTGNTKLNKGSLQMAGQLVLDPATLNESFLKATKFAHYNDVHDSLLNMAEKVDYPRPGMTLIRKKRSDRVSPMDRTRGDFEEWAATHLDKNMEWKQGESGLTTNSLDEAVKTEDGKYLAVPDKVAKTLAGEFTRSGNFAYWMNRYPLRVWRALVLGLRPAYLVNNAVGNTLMYLVHSGRPEDLRQLAGAFKQFAKKSEGKQIDALLEKHFAGQVRGGFIASQYPDLKPAGKLSRGANAVVGAIPALDKRWEQALRRAKVKAELKRHPELKAHAQRMGGETAFFEKIAPILDEASAPSETFYHSTYHGDSIRKGGFQVSKNGESGAGVYLAPDKSMAAKYPERETLEVSLKRPVRLLDRTTPEGEAEFRRIQDSVPGWYTSATPAQRIAPFKAAGYDGVKYSSNGDLETVIHDPSLLRVGKPKPNAGGQHIVTQVYDRVNDALGNYDSMSSFERNAVRNLFPFYAWYKAISIIAGTLVVEQPLKVNILAHLGQIAVENNLSKARLQRDQVPTSVLGFIPTKIEGNRVRGFNTASINPYGTVGQLADFADALTRGPGAAGKVLPGSNPLTTDLLSYIFGQTPAGYGAPEVPGLGVIESLPQKRVLDAIRGTAPKGDTFNDRDWRDELLRYLGVPYARVSPTAAKRVAQG